LEAKVAADDELIARVWVGDQLARTSKLAVRA
jgi:hypothetical protein